jgi:hypothetical protein
VHATSKPIILKWETLGISVEDHAVTESTSLGRTSTAIERIWKGDRRDSGEREGKEIDVMSSPDREHTIAT